MSVVLIWRVSDGIVGVLKICHNGFGYVVISELLVAVYGRLSSSRNGVTFKLAVGKECSLNGAFQDQECGGELNLQRAPQIHRCNSHYVSQNLAREGPCNLYLKRAKIRAIHASQTTPK
jgi:hypothetical protein